MTSARDGEAAEAHRGGRSTKALSTSRDFARYQREWFIEVQRQVREDGVPFALVNADAPHELLRAMGIPYVVNQWWASICAAKQRSADYLGLLRERGYPDDQEPYSALALGSSFDDPDDAPWGGLPIPDLVMAYLNSDATGKIFELWAHEHGATFFPFEGTVHPGELEPRWFERMDHHWDEVIGRERIELMLEEMKGLIRHLEIETGRAFDETAFARVMDLSNEHEEYNRQTRDLIANARPAPLSVADGTPSVMIPQWHRGTEWGRDAAKRFRDEVQARVDAGDAAFPDERIRLMWIGRGLWFDMGFYQYFEERFGAVFVWSMYLAVGADCYLRYGGEPLERLAARFAALGDTYNMPPWSSEWYAKEAVHNGIDGVVHLTTDAVRGTHFITRRIEEAGIPIIEISGDNVDARAWDDGTVKERIAAFIEQEVEPRLAERSGGQS